MTDDRDTAGAGAQDHPEHPEGALAADEIRFLESSRAAQRRFAETWLVGLSPATEPATVLVTALGHD